MLENSATTLEDGATARPVRRRRRPLKLATLEHLDGRTRACKRSKQLAQRFTLELGGALTPSQRLAVERAAAMTALSEHAQARSLVGDPAITYEDVVRLDNSAARAVRALGIKAEKTLQQHLVERAAERARASNAVPGTPTPRSPDGAPA
jgi:hypothetical protein